MASTPDGQAYIDAMASAAGYVLDYHMIMARHDVAMFKSVNDLRVAIHSDTDLDAKTQELVYLVGYAVAGFQREHLSWHTRAALDAGATAADVGEAFQVVEEIAGGAFAAPGREVLAEITGGDPPAEGAGVLDPKIRELLLALGAAVFVGRDEEVASHTAAALDAGASPKELLDAFEFLPLVSGVITFMHAVETWARVTGAEGVEPTVPYFTMNNDGTPRST